MKNLEKYLLCFIFGIILFLVLNSNNGFSVGIPGELKPITDNEVKILRSGNLDLKKDLSTKDKLTNRDFKGKQISWEKNDGTYLIVNLTNLNFTG